MAAAAHRFDQPDARWRQAPWRADPMSWPSVGSSAACLGEAGSHRSSFVERDPSCLECRDWGPELRSARLSYSGEEACVAEQAAAEQLSPAVPPKELAGGIRLIDLVGGASREFLLL